MPGGTPMPSGTPMPGRTPMPGLPPASILSAGPWKRSGGPEAAGSLGCSCKPGSGPGALLKAGLRAEPAILRLVQRLRAWGGTLAATPSCTKPQGCWGQHCGGALTPTEGCWGWQRTHPQGLRPLLLSHSSPITLPALSVLACEGWHGTGLGWGLARPGDTALGHGRHQPLSGQLEPWHPDEFAGSQRRVWARSGAAGHVGVGSEMVLCMRALELVPMGALSLAPSSSALLSLACAGLVTAAADCSDLRSLPPCSTWGASRCCAP